MENFLDTVARMATVSYVAYLVIVWITSFFGLQLILLATLATLAWRARRRSSVYRPWGERDALPLQIIYGFIAALILALYQWQWRDANAAWDISARPDILATLYQIGFMRSRPHSAPRSSDFGARVAEACKAPWLRDRFGSSRAASR